jgi:hypothetical protein
MRAMVILAGTEERLWIRRPFQKSRLCRRLTIASALAPVMESTDFDTRPFKKVMCSSSRNYLELRIAAAGESFYFLEGFCVRIVFL